ncbi:DUF1691-domain-containing protein [Xylariaceae sp. FL0804]|nr:DUF1691-domain-containing protein [Xylariaceae sp. FL0804]
MASNPNTLHPKASEETMISLLQLEPQPIDNASLYEKDLPPLPEDSADSSTPTTKPASTAGSSASSLGLSGGGGGGGRGPIFYLQRIQRYSSYTFTVFAGLHLVNTSLIPLLYRSVPYSEPFLLMAREVYQTRLTEPLLVGLPIVAHVASGLAVRLLRRRQNLRRYGGATPGMLPLRHATTTSSAATTSSSSSSSSTLSSALRAWPPLSYISLSGYALAVATAAHVAMNRVLPLLADGDSSNVGLQYVAHGFARHPAVSWAAYAALLAAGAGHAVWGWARWLDAAPPAGWKRATYDRPTRQRRRRAWWSIQGAAVALAGLWAAGGLGVVARGGAAEGWLAKVYDNIYSYAGLA